MKKIQILISFTLIASLCWSQGSAKKVNAKAVPSKETEVSIKCTFENCSSADSLALYQVAGIERKIVSVVHAAADGSFTFKIMQPASPQFYVVGLNTDPNNVKPFIVSNTETSMNLSGPCFNLVATTVQNSKLNDAYADAINKINQLKIDANRVNGEYQTNYKNPELRASAEKKVAEVDARKVALLDSLKKTQPFIAKIVALDSYTSYLSNPKKDKFKDEIEYFATQYFQYVNWKDEEYNNIPQISDLFKSYTQVITLPQLGLTKPQQKAYFEALLKNIPAKTNAYKYALSGITTALMEAQNSLLIDMANIYQTEFVNEDMEYRSRLGMAVNNMKAQMIDVPAPEIVQADTTGKMRKLSDMKGKYVLLDFWASWCGPCRRENPNVVRLYGKYKDKGFDVFSVSLDQARDRWIKAIAEDGLVWDNHVSDLKYWSNEAARTYGVQSIPSTLLIDKQGVIIARNLRGEALEAKLRELMGE